MTLYERMAEYALKHRATPADLPAGELGKSLALFHQSLVEAGLEADGPENNPRLTATAADIAPFHLSHFIVAFLPFNSVTEKEEVNPVLFEVYSFIEWLAGKGDATGLRGIKLDGLMRELSGEQPRCLKLSHLLDAEAQRVLEFPPAILATRATLFRVVKISRDHLHLQCPCEDDIYSLQLSASILKEVRQADHLDLVIGDAEDRWVILEASRVFPGAGGDVS